MYVFAVCANSDKVYSCTAVSLFFPRQSRCSLYLFRRVLALQFFLSFRFFFFNVCGHIAFWKWLRQVHACRLNAMSFQSNTAKFNVWHLLWISAQLYNIGSSVYGNTTKIGPVEEKCCKSGNGAKIFFFFCLDECWTILKLWYLATGQGGSLSA